MRTIGILLPIVIQLSLISAFIILAYLDRK